MWEIQDVNPGLSPVTALIQLGLEEMLLKLQPNGMSWAEGQEWAQKGNSGTGL